jgi:hypothetical protein
MALQQSRETAYEVCVLRAIKNQNEKNNNFKIRRKEKN